jgi:hypothetical protein
MAAETRRFGDDRHQWILTDAARGEVFAAGHAEAGNDIPVALSTARAERTEGGYRFYGHKHFGSLSPVWTRFGVHAMDASDPANPVVVHGFVDRADEGYEIVESWDTLGMRATQSHDTRLNGVFVADSRIGWVSPAGSNADLWGFVIQRGSTADVPSNGCPFPSGICICCRSAHCNRAVARTAANPAETRAASRTALRG